MKKLLKILLIVVVLIVVAVGVAVGYVFHNIDSLAKRGVEEGGSYALGVPTTVDSVSVKVFGGDLKLSGLKVANPQGFAGPHFLTMKKGEVVVTLDSLNEQTVDIPKLTLSGIDLNLERTGSGANYEKIVENLKRLKGSSAKSGDKKLIVHELTIEDVRIHADVLNAPGPIGKIVNPVAKVDVPIERIELKDVGRTGTGVTMEELSSIVVQAVLAAAAEKGYGTLPGEIVNDLKSAVSSLGGLRDLPVAVVGRAGEAVTQIGGVLGDVSKRAGDAIKDATKGIADGIGDILGGGKDKKNDKAPAPKKP